MIYLIIVLAIATVLIIYVIRDDNRQMDEKVDNYQAQNDRDKRMIEKELGK